MYECTLEKNSHLVEASSIITSYIDLTRTVNSLKVWETNSSLFHGKAKKGHCIWSDASRASPPLPPLSSLPPPPSPPTSLLPIPPLFSLTLLLLLSFLLFSPLLPLPRPLLHLHILLSLLYHRHKLGYHLSGPSLNGFVHSRVEVCGLEMSGNRDRDKKEIQRYRTLPAYFLAVLNSTLLGPPLPFNFLWRTPHIHWDLEQILKRVTLL